MKLSSCLLVSGSCAQSVVMPGSHDSNPSTTPFSSQFRQPDPPLIQPEFKANWNQHKWNANVSHVASGYIYFSPTQQKVRADMAYDGTLGSSLFDFADMTEQGVANTLWTLAPAVASPPQYFTDYVQPAFPLVAADFLVTGSAVFAGVVDDPYVGRTSTWKLFYAGVPATVYLNDENVVCGYDFWATNQRTNVITRFFNIVTGPIPADTFDFPRAKRQRSLL